MRGAPYPARMRAAPRPTGPTDPAADLQVAPRASATTRVEDRNRTEAPSRVEDRNRAEAPNRVEAPNGAEDPIRAVWPRYRDNLARHLIGIARDLQHRAMHQLTEALGHRGLRPSLGPLISLVAPGPRPLGALAAQLAISPQAASQLVGLAETAGYLVRRADPEDGRSRRVQLTPRGHALVEDAVRILEAIETDYRALLGDRAHARLAKALDALFEALGLLQPTEADGSEDRARTTPSLASSARGLGGLPLVSLRIQRDLMDATAAAGHRGLKMSHAQVLPLIGPEGARVRELARIQRVSRQAISATARDLEGLGVLCREPDPRDRRGVVFRLTPTGEALLADSVAALDALDARLRDLLGDALFADLEREARRLYRALELENEIFAADPRGSGGIGKQGRDDDEVVRLAHALQRALPPGERRRLAALIDPSVSSKPSPSEPAPVHAQDGRPALAADPSPRITTRGRARSSPSADEPSNRSPRS